MNNTIIYKVLANPYARFVRVIDGKIWDVAAGALAFAPTWGDTDVALTTNSYIGGIPVTIPSTLDAGEYNMLIYDGATPAATDSIVENMLISWDGSRLLGEPRSVLVESVEEQCVKKTLTTIMSGNNNLFVVSGGPIQIVELIGIVKTEIQGKSCLINYNFDPTSPAGDTVFGTDGTALEINADAVGAIYTWNGVVANDLVATDNGVALGIPAPRLVVPAGSLELAAVVATSATGAIDFYLRYKPLAVGASVVPA